MPEVQGWRRVDRCGPDSFQRELSVRSVVIRSSEIDRLLSVYTPRPTRSTRGNDELSEQAIV